MTTQTYKEILLIDSFRPHLGLGQRLARVVAAWRRWRNQVAALRDLNRLDDRALRDIGLDRVELRDVIEARLEQDRVGSNRPNT
jgi:uncharacterized protein YjiS (DUF1127 family)